MRAAANAVRRRCEADARGNPIMPENSARRNGSGGQQSCARPLRATSGPLGADRNASSHLANPKNVAVEPLPGL